MTRIDHDNPLWAPAPEPEPEILKLQLAALLAYLERPFWLVEHAAFLLAGVCPPERLHDDRSFGSFLPGRSDWQIQPKLGRRAIEDRISEMREFLREAPGRKGSKPLDYIEFAAASGIEPPWMEYAKRDPECAKFFVPKGHENPALRVENTFTVEYGEKERNESAQSLGGKAAAKSNPAARAGKSVLEFVSKACKSKGGGFLNSDYATEDQLKAEARRIYDLELDEYPAGERHFGTKFREAKEQVRQTASAVLARNVAR